jgi:hypothetical protein
VRFPDLIVPLGRVRGRAMKRARWVVARGSTAYHGVIVDPSGETAAALVDRLVARTLDLGRVVRLMAPDERDPLSETLRDDWVFTVRDRAALAGELARHRRQAAIRVEAGWGPAPSLLVVQRADEVFALDPDAWLLALPELRKAGICVVALVPSSGPESFGGSVELGAELQRGNTLRVGEEVVYESGETPGVRQLVAL